MYDEVPMRVRVAYEAIEKLVNGYSERDVEALVKLLTNDHPTLQQGYTRLFARFVKAMASKQYTDARNEASVRWARQIELAAGPDGPYLPLI